MRIAMPIKKVKGGWRWGKTGKVYALKKDAIRQSIAIQMSGYESKDKKKDKSQPGKKQKKG